MKKFLSVVLAASMAMSLVACGGGSSTSTSTSTTETSTGADTIKIGLLGCFTGDYAMYGNPVANGATLYFDEVNANGGINGKQIEVVKYDDKGDATEAVTALSRMVDDNIVALLGSVLTGTTIAVADETYDMGLPQITASATAAGVTLLDPEDESAGIRDNVFRACFIDPFQGEKMAQYAAEKMGATTVAVIYETGNDYAEGLKDAFVKKCAELGVTVTSEQAYATGDVDFKAQLTAIAGQNPDAVFCPNYYEDVGMIVTQARAVGLTVPFLGGDGWGGVSNYASAEDLEGCVYCSGYAAGTEPVKDFEAAYEAAYGEAVPNMFAPLGYDAAMLLCEAIRVAEESVETGAEGYSEAVIAALAATKGVEGVTGTYEFDEFNNPVKSAAMMQLQGGAEVFTELF